ncbi:MAG TPA: MBL fold metallo-hydrolase [Planctomycetes bacterium]|nr:MBL fold metallo-hydrolase [Planctomycetota bacterium]
MNHPSFRFFGAVRNVTGSKHLLEWKGVRILFDCGMVQGKRDKARKANLHLPFDPKEIDHVLLSHAHIDHSGGLPILVREGYRGRIWCTPGTKDLAAVLLEDSARIQEGDADFLNRHRKNNEPEILPLYTGEDSALAIQRLKARDYHEKFELEKGIEVEFFDAGHIIGSAQVVVTLREGGEEFKIAFTGDHGRKDMPILRDPEPLPPVDVLVTESTYGNRLHPDEKTMEKDLAKIVREEQEDGGRLLIPAFAVGRTQNLIYLFGKLIREGKIEHIPIYVDSPLARAATSVVSNHLEDLDADIQKMIKGGHDPFHFKDIHFTRSVEESKALNRIEHPCVIIAASGMCEGGRILHHLLRSLPRREDCVLVVGYMAPYTLGRRIVEKEKRVRIFRQEVQVRCQVRTMNGLSAHADSKELISSLRHLAGSVRKCFVVHGEKDASYSLRDKLLAVGFKDVCVPVEGERYDLWEEQG